MSEQLPEQQHIELLLEKAQHFNATGRHDLALLQLHKGLRDAADDVALLVELARTHLLSDELEEAERQARRALAQEPGNDVAHYLLGATLMDTGRHVEAELCLLEALRIDPHDASNFHIYGLLMFKTGRAEKAERLYRRALALDPDHENVHAALADLLVTQNRIGEAGVHGDHSLALAPDQEGGHSAQGHAALAAGRPFQARRHYREALRLGPDDELTREAWLNADTCCRWIYLPMYYWSLMVERLPGLQFFVWGVMMLAFLLLPLLGVAKSSVGLLAIAYLVFVIYTWVSTPLLKVWTRIVPPR